MISYRRDDSEAITGRIFDRLISTYGKDAIFRDIDNIPAGFDFQEHILDVLKRSDLLIVVIGRRWLGRSQSGGSRRIDDPSDPVRIEIEAALQLDIPMIPVLVGKARMPPAADFPEHIKSLAFRNALQVDAGQDFDNHISRLLRGINGALTRPSLASPQSRPKADSTGELAFGKFGIVLTLGVLFAICLGAGLIYLSRNGSEHSTSLIKKAPQSNNLQELFEENQIGPLIKYLDEHPADPDRKEIMDRISLIKRKEFDEWTIYEVAIKLGSPAYLRISSIDQMSDGKVTVHSKLPLDPSLPAQISPITDGSYQETVDVYDCKSHRAWIAETTYFSKSGEILYHYKWAGPELISSIMEPIQIAPGSLAATEETIVCNDQLRTPSVGKKQLAAVSFRSLSSTPAGDGELYYEPTDAISDPFRVEALLIARYRADKKLSDVLGAASGAFEGLMYRTVIQTVRFQCTDTKFFAIKTEYYDSNERMIDFLVSDPEKEPHWSDIASKSPLLLLRQIACSAANH